LCRYPGIAVFRDRLPIKYGSGNLVPPVETARLGDRQRAIADGLTESNRPGDVPEIFAPDIVLTELEEYGFVPTDRNSG